MLFFTSSKYPRFVASILKETELLRGAPTSELVNYINQMLKHHFNSRLGYYNMECYAYTLRKHLNQTLNQALVWKKNQDFSPSQLAKVLQWYIFDSYITTCICVWHNYISTFTLVKSEAKKYTIFLTHWDLT